MKCDIAIDLNHVKIYGTASKETLLDGKLYITGTRGLLFDNSLEEQPEQAPPLDPPLFLAMKNIQVQSNEQAQQVMQKLLKRYDDIQREAFESDDWEFDIAEVRNPKWFLHKAGHLFSDKYLILE
jgi:hypothetical protein